MKNLFLLPTDKPSRLYQYLVVNPTFILSKKPLSFKTAHHIYITSDEEIKEGDWYINLLDNRIWKAEPNFINTNGIIGSKLKKIILTTDSTLIADGVQVIDDEFLEWFVKNPSCEEVKIEDYGTLYNFRYLILIPQEEPKDLAYWKENAEEEYMKVPISVLRYITELEERMYSEEEVGELVYTIIGQYANKVNIMIDGSIINGLFEQFKKKA